MRVDTAAPIKGLLAGVSGTVAMTLALRRVEGTAFGLETVSAKDPT